MEEEILEHILIELKEINGLLSIIVENIEVLNDTEIIDSNDWELIPVEELTNGK